MRVRPPIGWLIGVLAAATAVGIGEFASAFVRPAAAPVIAVGNRLITLTPETAKRQGIKSAGTHDKLYLILGILFLLLIFGALIGELSLRRRVYGVLGICAFGAFGTYCALTANASRGTDVIPTLVGTVAAIGVLLFLSYLARPAADAPAEVGYADDSGLADRRSFLQGSAAVAGVAVVAGLGGRSTTAHRFDVSPDKVHLPAAESGESSVVPRGADLHKSGVPWRTPNNDFYRIDTALTVPQVNPDTWLLTIHGMVDEPIMIDYKQLLRRPLIDHWMTLNCVSNEVGGDLVSNALFRGALLADLLREAGVSPDSDQLLMRSVDGMTIGAPTKVVMDGRKALLAVGMNGKPLPTEHGFPVRVVVPGLYGYVSACKWVVDIEATTFADHKAYWVEGGWDTAPPIRISSRIDRPSNNESVNVGERTAIAGIAWDQHVGIERVEVQVDDGPWQGARLATVPSTDTWRQWVFPWTPEKSGQHTLRVRAVDAHGTVQDAKKRDVFPSGASGYHSVTVRAFI